MFIPKVFEFIAKRALLTILLLELSSFMEKMPEESRNNGVDYDASLIQNINLNTPQLTKKAFEIANSKKFDPITEAAWLLRAITLIDLTTLSGDDSFSNVERLCTKAKFPLAQKIVKQLSADHDFDASDLHVAAVCVYPYQVKCVADSLARLKVTDIQIAAVATGFPSGQYSLDTRLQEIGHAVADGATEIDIVINRTQVLQGRWREIYDEVVAMRTACGPAHMKTILAVGELGSYVNVYRASMVCMMAGADFIKTSTGKETTVNATLPVSYVMARAIKDYHQHTGIKVGFKPAGGIRNGQEAISWMVLMKEVLGDAWLSPHLFRFGASSLLGDLETRLYTWLMGVPPRITDLPMA